MQVKAYAKINLSLRVCGRNADGYHALESLVAFADYADILHCTSSDKTSFTCTDKTLETKNNLVMQAHKAVAEETGKDLPCHLHLEKHIPIAAGLGGGSADAAAALTMLADYFGLAFDKEKLAQRLGADVLVCLASSPAWMSGIGEKIHRPLSLPAADIVLVNPLVPLSTKAVFEGLNRGATQKPAQATPEGFDTLPALCAYLNEQGNDLTKSALAFVPEIEDCLTTLRTGGADYAAMSGSGATCFALVNVGQGEALAQYYNNKYKNHWCVATRLLI